MNLKSYTCIMVLFVALCSCKSNQQKQANTQSPQISEVAVMDKFLNGIKNDDLFRDLDPQVTEAIRYYESLTPEEKQKYLDSKPDFDVAAVVREAAEREKQDVAKQNRARLFRILEDDRVRRGALTKDDVALMDSVIQDARKYNLMWDIDPKVTAAIRYYESLPENEKQKYLSTKFFANSESGFDRAMRETRDIQREARQRQREAELCREMAERRARRATGRTENSTSSLINKEQFDLAVK
jgi:hypothetical protein